MKKKLSILLLNILFIFNLFAAEPKSLYTQINAVSFGPQEIGFGLAPTGADFSYFNNFILTDKLTFPAYFSTRMAFVWADNSFFGGYDYETGRPTWIDKYSDVKDWSKYISGYYFNPTSLAQIHIGQSFGINPIEKSGPLATVALTLNSRFEMALEPLDVHKGLQPPTFINPQENTFIHPFNEKHIQAYPWLQDNRTTLSNDVALSLRFDLTKSRGYRVRDGIDFYTAVGWGPKWFGNTISMENPTTDFYHLDFTTSQYLTLYSKEQPNGFNWLSIMLLHTSSITRTAGNIVPSHKLPSDRLENTYIDITTLAIYGPQFIAADCFTEIQLSYTTQCSFGHVVNENPRLTEAYEWTSYLSMLYHMKLFGFMHFSYYAVFNYMTGIHATIPQFSHKAQVAFYISL